MASNSPPFQVEDNADDYFFDKLVDDDDGGGDLKVAATSSALEGSVFTDGNESDEVKAFANLSIHDLDNSGEIKCDATSSSKHDLNMEIENDGQNRKVGTFEVSEYPFVPLHTLEFDNLVCKAENENGAAEVLSVVSKSSSEGLSETTMVSRSSGGSVPPGVREVEWSAFHADSAENDSNGFGSYSDFFSEIRCHNVDETLGNEGDSLNYGPTVAIGNEVHGSAGVENSIASKHYNEGYNCGESADQTTDVQDLIRSQYWEDLYPGWKYDTNTDQWYQVDGHDTGAIVQANVESNLSSTWVVSERKPDFPYLQQTAHSVTGTLTETGTTESIINLNQASQVSEAIESTGNWNEVSQVSGDTFGFPTESSQASQVNNGYPPHVVFDPQYPGWYYDTIAQEWLTLESYNSSAQSTSQVQDRRYWDGYASADTFSLNNDQKAGITQSQVISQMAQGFIGQLQDHTSARSSSNYNLQNSSLWHPQTVSKSEAALQFGGNQPIENHNGPDFSSSARGIQQNSVRYGGTNSYYENVNQGQNDVSMPSISRGYVVGGNLSQQFNDSRFNQNDYKHSNDYHNNQNSVYFSQQQIQSAQISYAPAAGRSSAGRPPHALVAFGFGGKLIVMKDNSSVENLNFGSQNSVGSSMLVLNLAAVVNDKVDASSHGMGICNYFQALCRWSLPGPLIGGSVGNKELNKWVDERIAQLESIGVDYTKGKVFRLLFSLLKIACQYYGKLRSPYGTDAVLKESDTPESAFAKVFAPVK